MIVGCEICGSEKLVHKTCQNCYGRDATEDVLYRAREAFARDEIDVDELEQRIHVALTDPPEPGYAGSMVVFR